MYALLSLALVLAAPLVHAGIYIIDPVQASQWVGGQTYSVEWVDDGTAPALSSLGECNVALYTGEYQLAQSLGSVDVSTTSSLSVTINPASGPDGQYYIVITTADGSYTSFSGSFALGAMTGTTPGGGSSTSASTPTTSATGSSTSSGSSTLGTTPGTTTGPTASGTSTTPTGTTTPTGSTSASGSSASPTLTTPTGTTTATGSTSGSSSSTTTPSTTSPSVSASASATNAAVRAGSSTSLGGIAALLALSGILAF